MWIKTSSLEHLNRACYYWTDTLWVVIFVWLKLNFEKIKLFLLIFYCFDQSILDLTRSRCSGILLIRPNDSWKTNSRIRLNHFLPISCLFLWYQRQCSAINNKNTKSHNLMHRTTIFINGYLNHNGSHSLSHSFPIGMLDFRYLDNTNKTNKYWKIKTGNNFLQKWKPYHLTEKDLLTRTRK